VSAVAAPAPVRAPRVAVAPGTATLGALALLGAAVVSATVSFGLAAGEMSPAKLLTYQWMSAPYIAAGLVAWARRPESRLGPLMYIGGVVTSVAVFQAASPHLLSTVGSAVDILPAALFLHVFLAFPDGRLQSPFDRALVATTYVAALGLQLVRMSLDGFDNEFVFKTVPDAARVVLHVEFLSVSALLVIGVGVLALRRRRRPLRLFLGLVIDLFALGLLLAASLFTIALFEWPGLTLVQRTTWIVVGVAPLVFLLGLLDARLARSAVGDLFVQLGTDPAPGELRDALAHALHDRSLEIAFWLPEYGGWADVEGREVELPGQGEVRATTLIEREGMPVAALLHDPALLDEPALLASVRAAAAMSLENARLHSELRARLEEMRGSRARIVAAAQQERRRMERNLHDGAQQRLVALSLQLSLLERQLQGDPAAQEQVDDARREIAASLAELRDLARGLHPAAVSDHGLDIALEQVLARAPVPVTLSIETEGRLPEPVEVAAFYVVSESLANVGKYAQATSASVDVSRKDGRVVIEVTDDGCGGADEARGSGIRGLADRVEALGGHLRVWSPVGGGTRVQAEIPCEW